MCKVHCRPKRNHLRTVTWCSTQARLAAKRCVHGKRVVELIVCSGCVMDCRATARGSIPDGNGVKTEVYVLRKGQKVGVLSLNDLAIDGT